jgi:hypothetical protein
MDYAQMLEAVREMSANQLVIISDNDREFILGIDMLLEMEERIPASYIPRVEKIYAEFQRNQVL